MSNIEPGKYQHYKGPFYEVIGICRHSETLEELVVYRSLYNDEKYGVNALWVRPLEMFTGNVDVNGESIPRFSKL
jgi:hypothetical protein